MAQIWTIAHRPEVWDTVAQTEFCDTIKGKPN